MKRRALFLDRDGVVNIDKGYVYRKKDIEFVDGIFDLVRLAKSLDYLVIVVTNQAGIGRGYYSTEQFWSLMEWISERFCRYGGALDGTYFCPDHPIYGVGEYKRASLCRKPAPGMLLSAIRDWDIDEGKSILIGDKISDIQAGNTAGVGVNLLFNLQGEENYQPVIHHLSQAKVFLSSSAFIVPA
ncbi:MAG: HAD family hydrolase [Acidithiobacillus sp.]|nr:HAD family hydrolase [Acidithiobacillus sp.]